MSEFTTYYPWNGKPLKRWPLMSDTEAAARVSACASAWNSWRETSLTERSVSLKKCAALLRSCKDTLAVLMAEEMGKPVRQGVAEAEKCAWVCEYYADNAASFLAADNVVTEYRKSYVAYEPLGAILAVMPWNFPLWQFYRFATPTLMAGNTVILKHALITSGCSEAIGAIMRDAGFPADVVSPVFVADAQIEALIKHPQVRGVTLTGSTRAGRAVGTAAGAVLKKSVLELGGSDPYLVLEDADLDLAADACVASRLINSGQSCIAAKRFIVIESVRKKFTDAMIERLKTKLVGDPLDPKTDVGPQARIDLRDALHRQIHDSVVAGAKTLLGGHVPEGEGFYYPITVLTDVRKGMRAFDEELFGPVATIIGARDESEAIHIANDSVYGLGAAVFTRDLERGETIARTRLNAGCCFVNDFVKSDPRLPFGGLLESGYGRELGIAGLREFVNIKSIVVK